MSRSRLTPERLVKLIEPQTVSCWLWAGYIDPKGYGRYSHQGAHRVVYELLVGPIPDDLPLDHLCRVPRCVNPDHLEPVTHRENSRRGLERTHCIHGHRFSRSNSYLWGGRRYCRACTRRHQQESKQRRTKP